MNAAQNLLFGLGAAKSTTTKLRTEGAFRVTWLDESVEEMQGTDIVDAVKKAGYPVEKFDEMVNWEFVTPKGSPIEQLAKLAGVVEEKTFEICIDQLSEMDFWNVNGKLPPDIAELLDRGHDISHYVPPTAMEQLVTLGWQDEYQAILISGMYAEPFTHKFLIGLLHADVPVVYDIQDESTLPKKVLTRMFKVTAPESDNEQNSI